MDPRQNNFRINVEHQRFQLLTGLMAGLHRKMSEPDRIDLKILDLLQPNGRMSVTEVGEQVGLSTSPCSERIKRLERQGLITGYHARVDAAQLGKPLRVFIEITLSQKSPQVF
jgi:Lrp/AsnC family leucine-responsive transcriptional regulator